MNFKDRRNHSSAGVLHAGRHPLHGDDESVLHSRFVGVLPCTGNVSRQQRLQDQCTAAQIIWPFTCKLSAPCAASAEPITDPSLHKSKDRFHAPPLPALDAGKIAKERNYGERGLKPMRKIEEARSSLQHLQKSYCSWAGRSLLLLHGSPLVRQPFFSSAALAQSSSQQIPFSKDFTVQARGNAPARRGRPACSPCRCRLCPARTPSRAVPSSSTPAHQGLHSPPLSLQSSTPGPCPLRPSSSRASQLQVTSGCRS